MTTIDTLLGYWAGYCPDKTAIVFGGWLHTGDLGFRDAAGFLHLVGRKKELIISGGVNVYPRDIEEVAMQHPGVAEVAVFGIPDSRWGECPVAAVVLKPHASIAADELCTWINANVAARFQRVQQVVLHRDFPRNAAARRSSANCASIIWQVSLLVRDGVPAA